MEKFFISTLPVDINKEHQLREAEGSILVKYMASLLLHVKPRDPRILIMKSYQMKKNTLIPVIYILNNNIQQKLVQNIHKSLRIYLYNLIK